MVFVRVLGTSPVLPTLCLQQARPRDICSHLQENLAHLQPFTLYHCGRRVDPCSDERLCDDASLELVAAQGLPGGKGSFGALLRSIKIEGSSNRDACRDISGRRLRDIKNEESVRRYISRQSERDQAAKEVKNARLDRLRRVVNGENKHEFHDPKYNEERTAATERVHDAMEQAIKARKAEDKDKEPQPSTSGQASAAGKRKLEGAAGTSKGLWMGVELNDSDLEDSSSEEEEEASPAKKKK